MQILDIFTILCTGLMTGNELAVSLFVHPALDQLEEEAWQAQVLSLLARSLGRVMPFWYGACLALLLVEMYLHRNGPGFVSLVVAVVTWSAAILFTIAALVPINNRIARLTPLALPLGWRQEHKKWDRLHRWRILLLVVAMVALTYGLLASASGSA